MDGVLAETAVHENALQAGAESSVHDLLSRVARFWPVASYASSRFSDARKKAFAAAPNAPSDKEALIKEIAAFDAEERQRIEDWRIARPKFQPKRKGDAEERQRAEQHAAVESEHQNAVHLEMDRIGLKRKAEAGERLRIERDQQAASMGKSKVKLGADSTTEEPVVEKLPKPTIAQQWDAAWKEGIRLDLERKANDVKRKADALERQRKKSLQQN